LGWNQWDGTSLGVSGGKIRQSSLLILGDGSETEQNSKRAPGPCRETEKKSEEIQIAIE
jgi:hypothetical protein